MKTYEVTVTVDEKKFRNSIESDDAITEEMIKQVIQTKLDDQKWFDDTGIIVKDVYQHEVERSANDVNWDDE